MQSGYGGVSEMQQFLVDAGASSLFSIPPPPQGNTPTDIHGNPLIHPHQHPIPPGMPHFSHFQPMPITQQLFQQSHHQFQLFHQPHPQHHHPQEQRRMVQAHHHHQLESGPENSSSPNRMINPGGGQPQQSFLAAMNFKLGVNDSSGGGGSREGMNDDEGILQGDDGSESRFHPWQREEESAIKEPFWRPLDLDFINCRENKRCKEKEPEASNAYNKKNKDGNYKLFSELEAICKPGGGAGSSSGAANNQTRSGSALTGDENPFATALDPAIEQQVAAEAEHESDTSTGGAEPPPGKLPTTSSGKRKRKRRHQHQQQLTSITAFFESLVKQLMEHQDSLHRKFMEVMERRDQERTAREEAWRKQEAAKANREAAARAEERALAAAREAAIIAFLEKITGETLNLPTKSQFQSQLQTDHIDHQDINADENLVNPMDCSDAFDNINVSTNANSELNGSRALLQLNTSRWPRAEVQALIRVRGGLEPRFQEPGLKGPLWEEVSTRMASIGYHRSSKRCKEKWENINKYFRKTKDSGKKRPQHSKTCPYFHQLDQLYSSKLALPPSTTAPSDRRDNSELLDAIVVSTEPTSTFKFPEPGMMDFNEKEGGNEYSAMATKVNNDEEDDNDEEDGADEEDRQENEGEGESQVQWQEQQQFQSLHT